MDSIFLHLLIFLVGAIAMALGVLWICKREIFTTSKAPCEISGNGNLRRIRILNNELTTKEQALLQATAKFEALFQYAPVCINSFSADGTIDLWNGECVRILGYTKEEVNASDDVMNLFYGKDAEKVWKDIKNPKGIFREYSPRTKEGKKIKMAWANIPLPSGNVVISVGYIIKTHRKSYSQSKKRGPRHVK